MILPGALVGVFVAVGAVGDNGAELMYFVVVASPPAVNGNCLARRVLVMMMITPLAGTRIFMATKR